MNPSIRKHRYRFAFGIAALVCTGASALHPFGAPKRDTQPLPLLTPWASAEVSRLFQRSCMDCHSNSTNWPWYSYVAPTSWLVERDVHSGRRHLNLSGWQQYTNEQKQKLLADIASVVKNGEMPLPQYLLIHRQAALSSQEIETLYQWARTERKKLREIDGSTRLPSADALSGIDSSR